MENLASLDMEVPPQHLVKECSIPVEVLLEVYQSRVDEAETKWRVPLGLFLVTVAFLYAALHSDVQGASSLSSQVNNLLSGPNSQFQVYRTSIVPESSFDSASIPSPGPLYYLDDIHDYDEWAFFMTSQFADILCSSQLQRETADGSIICGDTMTHRVKFSREDSDCVGDIFGSWIEDEFEGEVSCQKTVLRDCFRLGFASTTLQGTQILAAGNPGNHEQSVNECPIKNGIGSLQDCAYVEEYWDTVEVNLTASTLEDRINTVKQVINPKNENFYGNSYYNEDLVHRQARVLKSSINIMDPEKSTKGHVTLVSHFDISGKITLEMRVLTDGAPLGLHHIGYLSYGFQVLLVSVQVVRFWWDSKRNRHILLSPWVIMELATMIIGFSISYRGAFSINAPTSTTWRSTEVDNCEGQEWLFSRLYVQQLLAVQFALLVLLSFKSLRKMPSVQVIWRTITKGASIIIPLVLILLWCYVGLDVSGLVVFGPGSVSFSSFSSAMMQVNLLTMSSEVRSILDSMKKSNGNVTTFAEVYVFFVEVVFHLFLQSTVLAIIVGAYLELGTKEYKQRKKVQQINDEYDASEVARKQGGMDCDFHDLLPEASRRKRSQSIKSETMFSRTCNKLFFFFMRNKQDQNMTEQLSMRDIDILSRLNEWARRKPPQEKYFISFNELRRVIGTKFSRRGVPKFTVSVHEDRVASIFRLVETYHVYHNSQAQHILSGWEQELGVVKEQVVLHSKKQKTRSLPTPDQLARFVGRIAENASTQYWNVDSVDKSSYSLSGAVQDYNIVSKARNNKLQSHLQDSVRHQQKVLESMVELEQTIRNRFL